MPITWNWPFLIDTLAFSAPNPDIAYPAAVSSITPRVSTSESSPSLPPIVFSINITPESRMNSAVSMTKFILPASSVTAIRFILVKVPLTVVSSVGFLYSAAKSGIDIPSSPSNVIFISVSLFIL